MSGFLNLDEAAAELDRREEERRKEDRRTGGSMGDGGESWTNNKLFAGLALALTLAAATWWSAVNLTTYEVRAQGLRVDKAEGRLDRLEPQVVVVQEQLRQIRDAMDRDRIEQRQDMAELKALARRR